MSRGNGEAKFLDTACDGHIVPNIFMNRDCIRRIHNGYVDLLQGKAYAPQGTKYLVSVPMLDRAGCTATIRVYER